MHGAAGRLAGRDRAARHHAATARRHSPWRMASPTSASSSRRSTCRCTASPRRRAIRCTAIPLLRCHRRAPNPACLGAVERTFDVDLAGTGRDRFVGHALHQPDQPAHRPGQPAAGRSGPDHADQVDPGTDGRAGAPGSLPAGPVGIDPDARQLRRPVARLHRRRHVRAVFAGDLRTVALAVPGGVLTQLLLDSAAFGPRITAA